MPSADSGLSENFTRHDRLAFDQLFFKYKTCVYRFAHYLTQNKNEADDLFQETWLRVVKNINQTNKRVTRKKSKFKMLICILSLDSPKINNILCLFSVFS